MSRRPSGRCIALTRAPDLTGSVRVHDGTALVMLAGEADLASEHVLREVLWQAVDTGARSVVVDMALVSFCDARGLGVLVTTSRDLREAGRRLSVSAAPPALRRLFQLTGLTEALWVAPATLDEGLLIADLAAAARVPLTRGVVDAALRLVVVMSKAVMAGADGVSITLPRDGRLRTVAASNDVVLQMDHDQYTTAQGPCLDAATLGEPFSSSSLAAEQRWPEFVPRAPARGIASVMSTPLLAGARPLGALNVYSRAAGALASHEQQWATQFAEQASNVLLAADTRAPHGPGDARIREALVSREVIAQAQGAIMTRQRLSPDAAYRFLVDISRTTGKPLLTLCREVVAATAPHGKGNPTDPTAPAGQS